MMQNYYDYKRYAVLYVDDEEKSLKMFALALGDKFRILTAPNAAEGFRLLEKHKDEIAVLMTDQRMPGEKGVQLLEKARQLRPRILRILATAYSDIEAAVDAVNTGSIYKYVSKPWNPAELEVTLRRALEFFIVQHERDQLLREKLSVLHNMMIADRVISLGIVAAGLGHYVRNSLMAVRTFLDLAPAKLREENVNIDELRNPNFWRDFYQNVQTQVARIGELLGQLGAVAEKPAVQFTDTVKLGDVLKGALERVNTELTAKHIQISVDVAADLPPLRVDLQKFEKLFDLLLKDEAINLTEGCQVRISAKVFNGKDGVPAGIQLQIIDNGPGLPEDSLRSIFDPFTVRNGNPQEFGLNLMTCYFIVYHHGGRIEVSPAELDKGTKFLLHLPLQPEQRQVMDEAEFLSKVLLNDSLWEKLQATY